MRPAFAKGGKVTASNAPGLNDGASAMVVSCRAKAEEIGVSPMEKNIGDGYAAVKSKAAAKTIALFLEKIGFCWPH